MKKIVLINFVIMLFLFPMACSSMSEREVIDKSYNYIQITCDKDKLLTSFPKSTYKAWESHKLWRISIGDSSEVILLLNAVETDVDGNTNEDFEQPKFDYYIEFHDRDYFCGRGWRNI